MATVCWTGLIQIRVISIHATHTGGDDFYWPSLANLGISIHATHTGGDQNGSCINANTMNFNPRHPYGWRPGLLWLTILESDFNPRHPYGWRPCGLISMPGRIDFNPRHPYGWRHQLADLCGVGYTISIHATHTGGDAIAIKVSCAFRYFNPRHPYGWRPTTQSITTCWA